FSTRRRIDGVCAVAAGTGVALLSGTSAEGSAIGVVLAVAAAISVAISILIARRVGQQATGLDGLALSVVAAAVFTLPLGLAAAPSAVSPQQLLLVAAIGTLTIAIPYALEFSVIRRVGVKTYSILLSLDPAIAALAGLVLLGQGLDRAELL